MENIQQYIKPELLILIPVLYIIGMGLKRAGFVRNNLIPLILGGGGVVMAMVYVLATGSDNVAMWIFTGVTQGILCAGASVYINQLIIQAKK